MEALSNILTEGAYLVATNLNGRLYGMICSWATQITDNRILLCIGSQSHTGVAIRESREFSLSVLSENQYKLALKIGSTHSDDEDKFIDLDVEMFEGKLPLLKGACKHIVCDVMNYPALGEVDKSLIVGRIRHFSWHDKAVKPLVLDESS